MKITNLDVGYLNQVKDLERVDTINSKLPDSIAETPDLSELHIPASKLDVRKELSEGAKLSSAAQESLIRMRIESQIAKKS